MTSLPASVLHTASMASATAAGALAAAVWEGLVLAACVALCLRLLPRLGAAARSAIWMAVFAVIALLPFAPGRGGAAAGLHGVHGESLRLDMRWSLLLVGIWLALSTVRAVRFATSAVHLRRVAGRAVPVRPEDLPVAAWGGLGDLRRRFQVCVSADVDRPSVAGFFSPRILLPPGLLEKLSAVELEQVLLHETEHLRRRDDWTNLAQKLALVAFPLNPVLLWVERRLCLERELACDDCVLQATGARKAYALCLTGLAEHSVLRRGVSLALGAWERQTELARRVHRILRRPDERMGRTARMAATATLTLGLAAGGFLLAHSPRLIRFGPEPQMEASAGSVPAGRAVERTGAALNGGYLMAGFHGRTNGFGAHATLVKAEMPSPDEAVGVRQEAAFGSPSRFKLRAKPSRGAAGRPTRMPEAPVQAEQARVRDVRPNTANRARFGQQRMVSTAWKSTTIRTGVRRSSDFGNGADSGESQQRLTLTVSSGAELSYTLVQPVLVRGPAYAAVPVAGGWIIFQL